MKRYSDWFMGIIFMLIITLPYLFAHRNATERVSDMENRMLAAYPSIWTEEGLNQNYPSEYETWLSDNLRGRTLMVKYNSMLQYQVFHRIIKEDTLEGKNHWLFINNADMIAEYQHLNLMSEQELDDFSSGMTYLADYLNDKGIAFYYFQCLDKESIYPKEYASGIYQVGEISRADQIVNRLIREKRVPVIYPKELLLQEAKQDVIYFQYCDLEHWNEKGAYLGYAAMMNRIAEDFPQVNVLQPADYDIDEVEKLTELYGYPYPYTEIVPIYKIRNQKAVEQTENDKKRWEFLNYKEHTHYYQNPETANDLKILLVGDSFIRMFIKDDVAEGFQETLSVDWMNIPILNSVVEEYEPDIVVLECTEASLNPIISYIAELKK